MAGGVGAAHASRGWAEQLGRADAGLAGEHAERRGLGLDRVGGDEVELGAVAGRDRGGLVIVSLDELGEDPGGAALGQRQALAQLERRGPVGDAEGEQLAHVDPLPDRALLWLGRDGLARRRFRVARPSASLRELALDPAAASRP